MCKARYSCGWTDQMTMWSRDQNNGQQRVDVRALSDCIIGVPSVDDYIRIVQDCKEKGDPSHCKLVYAEVCNYGLESHYAVGNDVVRMFVECGSVWDAQQVFDKLAFRNVHSWTSLVRGYVRCGQPQIGLDLYQKMNKDAMSPSSYTVVPLLKACVGLKDMEASRMIHIDIVQMGFNSDPFVGSMLVDMYTKFNVLYDALEVLKALPDRDVVSWSALITGYAEHGRVKEAWKLYDLMRQENVSPSAVTFLAILKACSSNGAIDRGREIHGEVLKRGFEEDLSLGNSLVDMYAKCGLLLEANLVFSILPVQESAAWNGLITGYTEHGLNQEALDCYEQMRVENICTCPPTFVCALKACATITAIRKGQTIHTHILQKGLEDRTLVGNAILDMYLRCGFPLDAQVVFNKLSNQDVITWNILITGYVAHELFEDALMCYDKMKNERVSPDAVTFVCAFKACGYVRSVEIGFEMHTEVMHKAFEEDILVGSTLVDMYSKCGALAEAQKIFDGLSTRNIVLWNALIAGYSEYGYVHEALYCFEQLQKQGVLPNNFTYVCLFKACSSVGAIEQIRYLHMNIERMGLERNFLLGSMMVDAYVRCDFLTDAHEMFNKLQARNVMTWNVLISGYVDKGSSQAALDCLNDMQLEGHSPDAVTYTCAVEACSNLGLAEMGREMHMRIMCKGYEADLFIKSTLIDMYAKCGLLVEAQETLQKLPVRNIVPWNTAIAGFTEHGFSEKALQLFEQMQLGGCSGDTISYVGVLKACVSLAAIDKGREIHREIALKGLEGDLFLGSTLVCLYAKCGWLPEAQVVFNQLELRNLVVWNAMIKGYGLNNEAGVAINFFQQMLKEGVEPDDVTFICLLTACSRVSLVDKGEDLFRKMSQTYGISPSYHHFSCVVDLLGRSGRVDKAEKFLGALPHSSARESWRSLLTACKTFEEAELGSRCFQQLTV